MRAPLPRRCEMAETFDADWRLAVEKHARMTNPRIVSFSDEAWEEMHRSIRRTNATWIHDAPRFVRPTGLGAHDHTEPSRCKIKGRYECRHGQQQA